jgi:heme exporter protein A
MPEVQLVVSNLSKWYGDMGVLNKLSFRARSGDCILVVGPNGSGKTTLIMCLLGLVEKSGGEIQFIVNGRSYTPTEALPFVGAVLEACEPYEELTAYENLSLFASLKLLQRRQLAGEDLAIVSKSERGCYMSRESLDELMEKFQLKRYADQPVSSLSSGIRQRLKFAIACVANPLFLMLDEPTVNLDLSGRELLTCVVKEVRGNGGIVVWTTCDEGEVENATALINLGEANIHLAHKGFES